MLYTSHKHSDLSDEKLLQQFRDSGDLDLLGSLYARYMHLVYGVCLKYLAKREDAQDAVMQVFEKLIVEIPRHEVENFKSWLFVMSKNHCFMELRSRKSATRREEAIKHDPSFMESGEELHPIDREDGALGTALEDCIEKLKNEQKSCIRLFYYEKLSYRDIASQLKLDEKKVKSHIQNAKRNLKICLEASDAK